jgi:phosphocarrier protein
VDKDVSETPRPECDARTAERKVPIGNRYGLHGRPTTMFVKLANRFDCEVRVSRDGDPEEVDGKSAIALLSLGLERGGVLSIRTTGADAEDAIAALEHLVRNNFEED